MEPTNWMRIALVLAGGSVAASGLVAACRPPIDDTAPGETGDSGPDTGSQCVDDTSDTTIPIDTSPPDTGDTPDDTAHACPDGMVPISATVCMDRWEASRPDATASSFGTDTSRATSRQGVLPWMVADATLAVAACNAAGKRLCTTAEWIPACQGPDASVYPYGDTYEAETCNGIDTQCDCEGGRKTCHCEDGERYAYCWRDCGGVFRLRTTGGSPGCVNEYGVYDISGNLWEYTMDGSTPVLKGGAYNCADSVENQRCDFVPDWNPSARGFRCCADL
ncbi:MAG: SUMF1/EgtB/PvdO family nonheme iron enzyme [Deltaproteobacteria bacterium]|nr:SUMF1/EgtB/PvdO family nonheme iron enzyme [Deltaproteobacteria bacterium]